MIFKFDFQLKACPDSAKMVLTVGSLAGFYLVTRPTK